MIISQEEGGKDGNLLALLNNSKEIKKGLRAEDRVKLEFEKMGCGCFHLGRAGNELSLASADLFVYKRLLGSWWVQVKYKEPRINYPDTGMQLYQYKKYIKFQENTRIPMLILFVERSGEIYGDWLYKLNNYKSSHGGTYNEKDKQEMIYFLVDKLKAIKWRGYFN